MRVRSWFLAIALVGTFLDLWTKSFIFRWLDQGAGVHEVIPGFFRLVQVENTGGMWGIGAGYGDLLKWLRVGALFVIVGFLFRLKGGRLFHVALALIFAGALGNLYDSFFNDGKVRDFLDFYVGSYHWPAFNLADSFICVGSGLLLVQMAFERRPATAPEPRRPLKEVES